MLESVKALCKAWNEAGSAVVITGAGASTESGVPDFTGEGGIYGGASVKKILSRDFMLANPQLFNQYCRERLFSPFTRPNSFHKALAEWEETGLVTAVITQNIDSLHQLAGSKNVVELHGNMQRVYCDTCKRGASAHLLYGQVNRMNKCPHCGGVIRPSILLYGEQVSPAAYASAKRCVESVPLLIVAGTRMRVTAPQDLLERFKQYSGGVCAYIGAEPPDITSFDIVVTGKLGEITAEMKKYMY